ncbi:gypsy-16 si [Solea senegalensis]|uniref:Gypsy retrotransposon integrase-like protein 1 n=1 Tax=Solea senegalensis TaxID=28829 RepID=A0AAV6PD33_SOLSE|nr:gypsy-16 si [Solea senegalensis]
MDCLHSCPQDGALLATTGSGHKPLRLYRWSERLQAYNFTTQFTPGQDNVVADLLSRVKLKTVGDVAQDPSEPELVLMLHTPLQGAVSLRELQDASAQDSVLNQLRTFIREGWPSKVSEELAPFHRVKDDLSCWNDVCVARGLCTVVPSALRARILAMVHEGHLGVVRVKQRCRGLVWWPGIDRDVETMVKDCTACLTSGKTGLPPPPPLQPLPWPLTPWTHIQVDICGELHGDNGPQITDNGPQFISADFSSFLAGKGIKHIKTAFYHPQANVGVERFNQTLKNGLRAHLAGGLPFLSALQSTLLHYRATSHATTGSSPALLMLGREMQLPLDRLRPQRGNAPAAAPSLRGRVAEQQRCMKQRFDRKHRVKGLSLGVLDWVRIRRPSRSHKLLSFWSAPQQITAQLGPATFRLADGSRWHASRLRLVKPPSTSDQEAVADQGHTVPSWDFLGDQPEVPVGQPPEAELPAEPLQPNLRPFRVRRRPLYLRDYDTG